MLHSLINALRFGALQRRKPIENVSMPLHNFIQVMLIQTLLDRNVNKISVEKKRPEKRKAEKKGWKKKRNDEKSQRATARAVFVITRYEIRD